MYVPGPFAETDREVLFGWIEAHDFGLLVTDEAGVPVASHLPFLLDRERGPNGTLLAHMARSNPQWKSFALGVTALAIFQGPHAYVSPGWYATGPAVPTWNYAAVHAYGRPRLIEDAAAREALLGRLAARHEAAFDPPWRPEDQPADFVRRMIEGIVAFEIPIATLEGKFKASQNRPAADRAGVIEGLRATGEPRALALAEMMAARESND